MDLEFRPSDANVRSLFAARWQLKSEAVLSACSFNLEIERVGESIAFFEDVDEAALLGVNWGAEHPGIPWPSTSPPAELVWSAEAEIVARWSARRAATPGCLVVVRQPLFRPDHAAQRDWIATVLRALDGDGEPVPGLLTANFFASNDGAFVLNFAEWTSARAHVEALSRRRYGRHGSIGSSALWRATREHPAVTPEHEVRRYARLSHAAARATRATDIALERS